MTTLSEMPVASATGPRSPDLTRVSTRARARVAATDGDGNRQAAIGRVGRQIAADARSAWAVAARPPSLRAWWRAQNIAVEKVPGGSGALRAAWVVDNWTTGLVVRGASIVLLLAGAWFAWLAGHPLRRWCALLLAGLYIFWIITTP